MTFGIGDVAEGESMFTESESRQAALRKPSIPSAIAIAELCLVPLLLAMFGFGARISRLVRDLGGDPNLVANTWFLESQSSFFTEHHMEVGLFEADRFIFGFFIWVSIPLVLLRLVSGPLLFSFMNARAVAQRKPYLPTSPGKVLLGCLFAGPLALWASMNNPAASVSQLAFLLDHLPRFYIWLQAFVFVCSLIISAEGLLFCVLLILKRRDSRLFNPYDKQQWGGEQPRAALASAGSAVLFFNLNDTYAITQADRVAFRDCDPTLRPSKDGVPHVS